MGQTENENFQMMILVSSFTLLAILAMVAAGRPIEALLTGVLSLGLASWWGQQRATRPRKDGGERLAYRLLDAEARATQVEAAAPTSQAA